VMQHIIMLITNSIRKLKLKPAIGCKSRLSMSCRCVAVTGYFFILNFIYNATHRKNSGLHAINQQPKNEYEGIVSSLTGLEVAMNKVFLDFQHDQENQTLQEVFDSMFLSAVNDFYEMDDDEVRMPIDLINFYVRMGWVVRNMYYTPEPDSK